MLGKFSSRMLGSCLLLLIISLTISGVATTSRLKSWLKPASTAMPARRTLPQKNDQSASKGLLDTLSLQPEADKQRRRLGKRFVAPEREVAIIIGRLVSSQDSQSVRIIRTLDDGGENLSITLNGNPSTLSWNSLDGAKVDTAKATGAILALIERVALDSPNQFVLAQLRGAAYFTVANSVRPAEAGGDDKYIGPMWNVVRIGEPKQNVNPPQSDWRLYYINSVTNLIDKVVSKEGNDLITAEFSNWRDFEGDLYPAKTVWKKNEQTLMELLLLNVSHLAKQ